MSPDSGASLAWRPHQTGSRTVWSWALYDFANSAFATLVITFIYGTYFTQAIAPDPITGTALWSRAITLSALVVAFCSPFLGALADRGGYRKRFVFIFTLVSIVATAALYRVLPGQVYAALALVVVANIGFESGEVFYNAFLPDVAPPDRIGRVSGYGWGLGYIGGLSALALALVAFVQRSRDKPARRGLVRRLQLAVVLIRRRRQEPNLEGGPHRQGYLSAACRYCS
jgi:UMF1 family MFS transporter